MPSYRSQLVSQTDVVSFMSDCRQVFGILLENATVFQMLESKASHHHRMRLVTVHASVRAVTAFKKMLVHKVQPVAVVNDENKFVTSLSASDLNSSSFNKFKVN